MPLYHFNVHDGISIPDEDGTELPDIAAAKKCAVQLSGQLLKDGADHFWNGQEWHMDVTDRHGLILFSLSFVATTAPSIG